MQGVLVIKGRSTTNGEQSPRYHRDLEIKQEGIKVKKIKKERRKSKLDVSYVKVQATLGVPYHLSRLMNKFRYYNVFNETSLKAFSPPTNVRKKNKQGK